MKLEAMKLVYNPEGKCCGVAFVGDGVQVKEADLMGTSMHLHVRCSPEVQHEVDRCLCNGSADPEDLDFVKSAFFFAILFKNKYMPGAEWEMDEDMHSWDAAALSLVQEFKDKYDPAKAAASSKHKK
jgi:cytolysin (calcineurin-like family phosphatase)